MDPKFSKLEEKVEELYTNNIFISTILTILKKPKSSIYTAIRRIKDKKKKFNKNSLNLNKTKSGPIKKVEIEKKELLIRS